MNIGAKIIEIRKKRNMTQEEFAKIFHVTRQTVSNWENQKSYPDLQTLVQISDEFDVSLDTLLKGDMVMVKKIDNFKVYKKAFIALTEDGVDYLVTPKSIGKYELDTNNFWLTARKGNMDITINIDENRKIFLALYPGEIEIDEKGNEVDTSKKLTDVQKTHMNNLLITRKEEILPIINRALELWDTINK